MERVLAWAAPCGRKMTAPKVKMRDLQGPLLSPGHFCPAMRGQRNKVVVDELDRKYGRDRWKKYEEHPSEFVAIAWLRMKKGWNHIKPTWLPLI